MMSADGQTTRLWREGKSKRADPALVLGGEGGGCTGNVHPFLLIQANAKPGRAELKPLAN